MWPGKQRREGGGGVSLRRAEVRRSVFKRCSLSVSPGAAREEIVQQGPENIDSAELCQRDRWPKNDFFLFFWVDYTYNRYQDVWVREKLAHIYHACCGGYKNEDNFSQVLKVLSSKHRQLRSHPELEITHLPFVVTIPQTRDLTHTRVKTCLQHKNKSRGRSASPGLKEKRWGGSGYERNPGWDDGIDAVKDTFRKSPSGCQRFPVCSFSSAVARLLLEAVGRRIVNIKHVWHYQGR